MSLIRFLPAFVIFALIASLTSAEVQQYDLMLGQRPIGVLHFDATTLALVSTVNNTPLGIGDGQFSAQSSRDGTQYQSHSAKRQIAVRYANGNVLATTITPPAQATALSVPAAVPAGVIALTEGFARLALAGDCPAPFRAYDGRRVVSVATIARSDSGTDTSCQMDYRVTHGPGHLSPFRFSTLDMNLLYRDGALQTMTVRAGGFDLRFIRQQP